MASLGTGLFTRPPITSRGMRQKKQPSAPAISATKGTTAAGGAQQEKGLWEWIIGGLAKDDQLLETDPLLKKVDDNKPTVSVKPKPTIPASAPKTDGGFGGLGGLFAKK